jgi:hypothetical protein
MDINLLAVITCTFGAFILSSIWYITFGKTRADLLKVKFDKERRPEPHVIALELLRTFVLALLFSIILSHFKTINLDQSLLLGIILWMAFPVILLSGSAIWDKIPIKLAVIHAGDWLLKLLLIAFVVGIWR